MTDRLVVLKSFPRATVYVTGIKKRFAILVKPLRGQSVLATQHLSNWNPTAKAAWANARFQLEAAGVDQAKYQSAAADRTSEREGKDG